ncbi:Uncharacterised protein [Shigella sonnei]|nr:Uncharacterised protein [Shigella sonnei]
MQGVSRPSLDSYKALYTGLYNAMQLSGHMVFQLQ